MREPTEHTARELHDWDYSAEEERRERYAIMRISARCDSDALELEWENEE